MYSAAVRRQLQRRSRSCLVWSHVSPTWRLATLLLHWKAFKTKQILLSFLDFLWQGVFSPLSSLFLPLSWHLLSARLHIWVGATYYDTHSTPQLPHDNLCAVIKDFASLEHQQLWFVNCPNCWDCPNCWNFLFIHLQHIDVKGMPCILVHMI